MTPLVSTTSLDPPPYTSGTSAPQSPAASLLHTTVSLRGRDFVDQHGRVLSLRGFNVSGASKLPSSPPSSPISFIDRPFPLSSARFHFSRLLAWGHPYIRLLVTWEALSHKGPHPSQVDGEYISYLYQLIAIAGDVGVKVTVCAHQDVFSRWSGGSGAPRWAFQIAGLDVDQFGPCASAWVGNRQAPQVDAADQEDKIAGAFVWPSGYQKLAAATMATLFWAGDTFAWKSRVRAPTSAAADSRSTTPEAFQADTNGLVSIQQLLQTSYLEAYGRLADVLSPLPALLGFEIQNEPHRGYIELHSWDKWDYNTDLHIGLVPSLRQSLALGSGHEQVISVWEKSWPFPTRKTGSRTVDPKGKGVWMGRSVADRNECLWKVHGVWDWEEERRSARVLRQDYFTNDPRPRGSNNKGSLAQTEPGEKVEWYRDCYAPFAKKFAHRMRRSSQSLQIHFGPIPNEFFPPYLPTSQLSNLSQSQLSKLRSVSLTQSYSSKTDISSTPNARPEGAVYAPHFYDLNVLFSKLFSMKWKMSVDVQTLSRGGFLPRCIYFGVGGLRKNYIKQMEKLISYARLSLGEVPIIIGEVGVPFDLTVSGLNADDSQWTAQEVLLDALAVSMEANNLAGWTWWNYNPDNSREALGDGWNGEDFSVVTKEEGERQRPDSEWEENVIGPTSESGHVISQHDLYKGGRALPALIRPYAVKLAGVPISSSFDRSTRLFEVVFAESRPFRQVHGGLLGEEKGIAQAEWTEIFLPQLHYGEKEEELLIELSDGECRVDLKLQSLFYLPSQTQLAPGTIHTISVRPLSPLPSPYPSPPHPSATATSGALRLAIAVAVCAVACLATIHVLAPDRGAAVGWDLRG